MTNREKIELQRDAWVRAGRYYTHASDALLQREAEEQFPILTKRITKARTIEMFGSNSYSVRYINNLFIGIRKGANEAVCRGDLCQAIATFAACDPDVHALIDLQENPTEILEVEDD